VMNNKGSRPVRLLLRGSAISDLLGSAGEGGLTAGSGVFSKVTTTSGWLTLFPGTRRETKADLVEVNCPVESAKGD